MKSKQIKTRKKKRNKAPPESIEDYFGKPSTKEKKDTFQNDGEVENTLFLSKNRKPEFKRKRKRDDIKNEENSFKRFTRQSVVKDESISNDIVSIDICSDEDTIIIEEEMKDDDQEITFEPVSLSQDLAQNCLGSLLWTCKYQPTSSDKVIAPSSLISSLKSSILNWSKNFKLSFETGEELNSTILIQGPPGIGKTSIVYALANELKFKVFEVNCSSIKNVTYLTKKLKEATQSHHVGRSLNIQIPSSSRESNSQNEANFLTKAKNTLFNYFNSNLKSKDKNCKTIQNLKNLNNLNFQKEGECLPALSLSSNSLILFDDVDFLIGKEVDSFWRALNSLVSTSKKPVILTTTQFPKQVEKLLNTVEVYKLYPPKLEDIALYLNEICLKEFEIQNCLNLDMIAQFNGDIRKCVNQLQFDHNFFTQVSTQNEEIFHQNFESFISSFYHSSILIDLISTKSKILFSSDLRKLFLTNQSLPFQDETNSRQLSIDIISSLRQLNQNFESIFQLHFDRQNIFNNQELFENLNIIRSKLSSNIPLSVISIDYLPYLYEIFKFEKKRNSLPYIMGRTRKSNRYCSYLKSMQLFDDDDLDISQIFRHFELF